LETPSYDSRVDVYSLGVLMAELLTREKPAVDPFTDVEQPIPYKTGVSKELIDICSWMVSKDPNFRPFIF
jgi:serine/threonine protein kinase